jgi:hypothetical protein
MKKAAMVSEMLIRRPLVLNGKMYRMVTWPLGFIVVRKTLLNSSLNGIVYHTINSTVKHGKGFAMKAISANELKTKGVSSIESALEKEGEAIISVRGKERYVVMDLVTYNRLRVCELEAALYQARSEIAAGKGIEESVDEHLARIRKDES